MRRRREEGAGRLLGRNKPLDAGGAVITVFILVGRSA